MKVYVLQRNVGCDSPENFGIYSTFYNAEKVLNEYKALNADGKMQIIEVELDKEVSF